MATESPSALEHTSPATDSAPRTAVIREQRSSVAATELPDTDGEESTEHGLDSEAPAQHPMQHPVQHAVEQPAEVPTPAGNRRTPGSAGGSRWTDAHRQRERSLLNRLADTTINAETRLAARNDLVVLHLPLVDFCARKFRDRGEPHSDLVGYGTVGLIKAVDRFDSSRGVEFSTFAMPTIMGEIKRHFRDRSRVIRLPRRLIDIASEAAAAAPELHRALGRQPEPGDIAERLGIDIAEVTEAQRSTSTSAVTSLDSLLSDCADSGDVLPHQLALWPREFDHVEWRESLRPALSTLDARDRQLLRMRFEDEMSQEAIAAVLGVSQMQVSRLLSRVLTHLRAFLADAA